MKGLAQALIILPPVLLLGQCTFEFFAVDACLDAGHLYDYAKGVCRSDVEQLPYVSYLERNWWLLAAAVVSISSGFGILLTDRRAS